MHTISDMDRKGSESDGRTDGQRVDSAVGHNVRTGKYVRCGNCRAVRAASVRRCPLCGK